MKVLNFLSVFNRIQLERREDDHFRIPIVLGRVLMMMRSLSKDASFEGHLIRPLIK